MAKTYLDQIVQFPAKVLQTIANDKYCVGLLINKGFEQVEESDLDDALDNHIFDYQYVDNTTQEASAYIWAEMEVNSVQNRQIKGIRLYVTVACHKNFMKLSHTVFQGVEGNRRDNLVRYVDRLLNNTSAFGIGNLTLSSVRTLSPIGDFVIREITYVVPDFNIVEIDE